MDTEVGYRQLLRQDWGGDDDGSDKYTGNRAAHAQADGPTEKSSRLKSMSAI